MLKLVALDIDGTLLNAEGHITDRLKQAMAALMRQGIAFTLCTGRSLPLAHPYAEELGITLPLATCNGAEIRRLDGEILERRSLPLALAQRVYRILHRYDALYELYSADRIVIERRTSHLQRLIAYNRAVKHIDKAYETLLAEEMNQPYTFEVHNIAGWLERERASVEKFYVMEHRPNQLEALYEELRQLPEICVTTSHPTSLEINLVSASKGQALGAIAEAYGYSSNEVAAVGDGMNDVSMFQYAGVSIAMGNASDQVKQHAKFVTGSNKEEGLAAALEQWIR
jgi:Cof subfamily protein (haloacid dehalogenase superfamily)